MSNRVARRRRLAGALAALAVVAAVTLALASTGVAVAALRPDPTPPAGEVPQAGPATQSAVPSPVAPTPSGGLPSTTPSAAPSHPTCSSRWRSTPGSSGP